MKGHYSSSSTPTSPAAARVSLPAEFQAVIDRLKLSFGEGLKVTEHDAEWVEVSVNGLAAPHLHAQLQVKRNALFASSNARMQIIQEVTPGGTLTYLHMLNAPDWSGRESQGNIGK